jgi:hypothetical protein
MMDDCCDRHHDDPSNNTDAGPPPRAFVVERPEGSNNPDREHPDIDPKDICINRLTVGQKERGHLWKKERMT